MKIQKIIILFILCFFTHSVHASRVFIDDGLKTFPSDKEFHMDVFLDTEGTTINAVKGEILFPDELVDFTRVSSDNGIVSTWIDPVVQNGNAVNYSGIIFNGFDTVVDPVTQEKKNGTVLRIYFKAKKEGSGIVQVIDSTVYKNDGKGTPIKLKDETAVFVISASVNKMFPDETVDTIPPEHFTPRVSSSLDVYNGKYFLMFSTIDKGSGIDHYEVKEGNADWVEASSPYLLTNESLLQKIQVKAVDRAGNVQIEDVKQSEARFYLYICIFIFLILATYFLYKRFNKFRKK